MLISPAERPPITGLGRVSSRPEQLGADILMMTKAGIIGIQRKEVADFVASAHDGRLAKEVMQLQHCRIAVLILEGEFRWTLDGVWMNSYTSWTQSSHEALVLSLQAKGIWILTSHDATDTCRVVRVVEKWAQKPSHQSLMRRPKLQSKSRWGTVANRDYGIYFLQGIDGIGPGVAENIFDHFGFVPLQWSVTRDELMEVEGIGKGRAEKMIKALGEAG